MRRGLALCALAFLTVTAGCQAFGPSPVDQERLDRSADYDGYWDGPTDVTVVVDHESYRAIYRLDNTSTLELYRFHRFNRELALDPTAVRFRYPNGTVTGLEADAFSKTRSRTTVRLPASNGSLAYTAPKNGKRVRVATVIGGSYEVLLPEEGRVEYPLLGRVVPRDYTTERVDGRVRLAWEDPAGDRIVVRYYLVRDLWLFGGLAVVAIALAIGGLAYFWLQLRVLAARREDVALPDDR